MDKRGHAPNEVDILSGELMPSNNTKKNITSFEFLYWLLSMDLWVSVLAIYDRFSTT
jgi:hypothetical protein